MDWTGGLDWWTGLVDWTGGLDWWTGLTGLVDWWTGGLVFFCAKITFVLSNETWLFFRFSHDACYGG